MDGSEDLGTTAAAGAADAALALDSNILMKLAVEPPPPPADGTLIPLCNTGAATGGALFGSKDFGPTTAAGAAEAGTGAAKAALAFAFDN